MQRLIKVDGKVRTDTNYPTGFMDTITIEKTGENFRLLFDAKGRFTLTPIKQDEANFKLCRVRQHAVGKRGIPYVVTHDGRTIRYPDPTIKANDTVKINIADNKIVDHLKFEVGNLAMTTGGFNHGRIGVVQHQEKHPGGYEIVHLKDSKGHQFATRVTNVFVIGRGATSLVSLPKGEGIRLTIEEEKQQRLKKAQ